MLVGVDCFCNFVGVIEGAFQLRGFYCVFAISINSLCSNIRNMAAVAPPTSAD